MEIRILIFSSIIFLFISCSDSTNTDNALTSDNIKIQNKVFNIKGEGVPIRTGPGNEFEKLINKKATEALGKAEYCTVDYSVKVGILEKKDDWAKIKIVDPEWLSESHIGWIPANIIMSQEEVNKESSMGELNQNDYEIIKTSHNSTVQNFHVLLKQKAFDKEYVYQFIKEFRKEHCTMNCNVLVYDTKAILPLIDIYPLEKKDYIKMADHLVSFSSSDATEIRDWYPYQDFKYRDYGGKNWKKNL